MWTYHLEHTIVDSLADNTPTDGLRHVGQPLHAAAGGRRHGQGVKAGVGGENRAGGVSRGGTSGRSVSVRLVCSSSDAEIVVGVNET